MSMTRFTRTAALSAVMAALLPQSASAMPAFARQYSLGCAACHSAVPRLNAIGECFAGHRFRPPNWHETTVDVGDSLLALIKLLTSAPLWSQSWPAQGRLHSFAAFPAIRH